MPCVAENVKINPDETIYMENIVVVPWILDYFTSNVEGHTINAINGHVISGATIRFRKGWNNKFDILNFSVKVGDAFLMNKKNIISICVIVFCYMIQFCFLPMLGVMRNCIDEVFLITCIISSIFCMLLTNKFINLIVLDVAYFLLILIYHPKGIYGIGMRGINLGAETQTHYDAAADIYGIALLIIIFFMVQVVVGGILKLGNFLFAKLKKHQYKR